MKTKRTIKPVLKEGKAEKKNIARIVGMYAYFV